MCRHFSSSANTGLENKQLFELLKIWTTPHTTKADDIQTFRTFQSETQLDAALSYHMLNHEETTRAHGRWWILHPHEHKRVVWDVLMFNLVLWDLVMIPLGQFEYTETPSLARMAMFTRVFWTVDLFVTFCTGFVCADGFIELRPNAIAKKYVRTWFGIDVVMVLCDWIEFLLTVDVGGISIARGVKATRIIRIVRMVRLLRLARVQQVLNTLVELINSVTLVIFIDLVKLLIIMLGSGHLLACMWYGVSKMSEGEETNWIIEFEYEEKPLFNRYVMAMRWAISQFAGGMDEVTPQSLPEHLYAVVVFFAAYWSGTVFVSILTSSMTKLILDKSGHTQTIATLRRYLLQHNVSPTLGLRIRRNALAALVAQENMMPEANVKLLKMVSDPLRAELDFEILSPKLVVHPFFCNYIKECPHVVRNVCYVAITTKGVSEGDVIFETGESPSEPKMHPIFTGALAYIENHGKMTARGPKDWIAEPHLWVIWVHRGRLLARVDSQLFAFDSHEFQTVVTRFHHRHCDPRDYAKAFIIQLNSQEKITDLPFDMNWSAHRYNRFYGSFDIGK